MKNKVLALFVLGLLNGWVAFGQFTSVTATITDSDSQTWNNGTWTATLYNPFPANPPSINGVPLTPDQLNLSGSLSNSGVLTTTMADNNQVAPTGTQWQFTICPNASTQCSPVLSAVTGSSENISTALSSQLRQLRFAASPIAYGYLDLEVSPVPPPGGQYFNVSNTTTRQWNGTAWQNGGGGGGSTFTTLKVSANNWSNGDSIGTAPIQFTCYQTLLPNDTGASAFGSTCLDETFTDYYPGAQYGYPGDHQSTEGYGSQFHFSKILSYANGTRAWLNSQHLFNGAGDINEFDLQMQVKPAWITGSDQGVSQDQRVLLEEFAYTGTVSSSSITSTDAVGIVLSPSTNGIAVGLNSPLIKTNTAQTGTLTYITTQGNGLIQATYNHTVAASVLATFAGDFSIPRVTNNTTGQLSATLSTVSLNVTTPLTPGEFCDVQGNTFQETIKIRSVLTPVSGVQTITAYFRYSHNLGSTLYCGGMAGHYVEYTDATDSNRIYVENVFGSLASNVLIVGHEIPGNFTSVMPPSANVNVKIYEGAEVVGVTDPNNNSQVNGQYLAVMPTATTWSASDTVMQTNNIAANYAQEFYNLIVYNPYATAFIHQEGKNGYGGGLNEGGYAQISGGVYNGKWLGTTGGVYKAPTFYEARGVWANGIAMDYAPVASANQSVGINTPNCAGYLLCVGQGPAPGATSSQEGIFTDGSQPTDFHYDHADQGFHFHSSGITSDGNNYFGGYSGSLQTIAGQFLNDQCIAGGCPTNRGGALFRATTGVFDVNGEVRVQQWSTNNPTLAFEDNSNNLISALTIDGAGNLATGSRGTHNKDFDVNNLTVYGTCTGCSGGSIANVTITLPTSLITANTCTSPTTTTMTGLLTSSVFSTAFATNPDAVTGWGSSGGLTVTMWPTADTLNWSVCNQTGSSITPGAMTLNVGAK